jgi:cobalt-zinc-cadmium efflux system outer membrane protein
LLGSGRKANPELGVDFKHDSRFGEGTVGVSFDQKFPVTSRLRLEKALSATLVTAAELEVRDSERTIIERAQALMVKLISLEQQRGLRQAQSDLAQKLSKFAADRSAAGELSALDAAQAQVDAQRLILESRKLETERVSLLGELKPKLGIGADDTLIVTGSLPEAKLPERARWDQRPDYQLARVNEDAARTGIDLAHAKKWEDITAGIMWEGERMEDAPNGLERTGFLGFKLSIPLPLWNRNEGEVAEKNAAALRAALETKALAAEITNEAAAARAEMEANVKLARETKDTLLPLVMQQTDRLESAYKSGQTDLLTVLRAREQRLQLESAVLDATRDFQLARIRYEAAVGTHAPAIQVNSQRSAVNRGK